MQKQVDDSITSAIVLTMEADKVEDPKGDRILLILDGKFYLTRPGKPHA